MYGGIFDAVPNPDAVKVQLSHGGISLGKLFLPEVVFELRMNGKRVCLK